MDYSSSTGISKICLIKEYKEIEFEMKFEMLQYGVQCVECCAECLSNIGTE